MRKIILILTICTGCLPGAFAQILHPVKWSYGAKRLNSREAVVFLKAGIAAGWHIYSVNQQEGGPVKTSITFAASPAYQPVGSVSEPTPFTKREEAFHMEVSYFEREVIFQQRILAPGAAVVNGSVNFMVCNNQQCLPPETIEFTIPVN